MNERDIKRLLIIVAASVIAIMLVKMVLTKTYTTLNQAVAEKRQPAIAKPAELQQISTPVAAAEANEAPAASAATETATVDTHAASSVSEVR